MVEGSRNDVLCAALKISHEDGPQILVQSASAIDFANGRWQKTVLDSRRCRVPECAIVSSGLREVNKNSRMEPTPPTNLGSQDHMTRVAHTKTAITDALRRGLSPLTDNEDALIELGFTRAYPQVRALYDAMIWERTIDYSSPNGMRKRARQRAFLDYNGPGAILRGL